MPFDLDAARASGLSDDDIAQHLASQDNFDYQKAIDAGLSSTQIAEHLAPLSDIPGSNPNTLSPTQQAALGGNITPPQAVASGFISPVTTTEPSLFDKASNLLNDYSNYLQQDKNIPASDVKDFITRVFPNSASRAGLGIAEFFPKLAKDVIAPGDNSGTWKDPLVGDLEGVASAVGNPTGLSDIVHGDFSFPRFKESWETEPVGSVLGVLPVVGGVLKLGMLGKETTLPETPETPDTTIADHVQAIKDAYVQAQKDAASQTILNAKNVDEVSAGIDKLQEVAGKPADASTVDPNAAISATQAAMPNEQLQKVASGSGPAADLAQEELDKRGQAITPASEPPERTVPPEVLNGRRSPDRINTDEVDALYTQLRAGEITPEQFQDKMKFVIGKQIIDKQRGAGFKPEETPANSEEVSKGIEVQAPDTSETVPAEQETIPPSTTEPAKPEQTINDIIDSVTKNKEPQYRVVNPGLEGMAGDRVTGSGEDIARQRELEQKPVSNEQSSPTNEPVKVEPTVPEKTFPADGFWDAKRYAEKNELDSRHPDLGGTDIVQTPEGKWLVRKNPLSADEMVKDASDQQLKDSAIQLHLNDANVPLEEKVNGLGKDKVDLQKKVDNGDTSVETATKLADTSNNTIDFENKNDLDHFGNPKDVYGKEDVLMHSGIPAGEALSKSFNTTKDGIVNAAKGVAKIVKEARSFVSPEGVSAASKETGGIFRFQSALEKRANYLTENAFGQLKRMFDKASEADRLKFYENVENGKPQASPFLNQVATMLRNVYDARWAEVQRITGIKTSRENFIARYWKNDVPFEDAIKMSKSKTPIEGKKEFFKKRSDETTAEMMARGKVLATTNPITATIAKLQSLDKFIYGSKIASELKDRGLVKFFRNYNDVPPGWVKIDDNFAHVYYRPKGLYKLNPETLEYDPVEMGVMKTGDYYAPPDIARIINNWTNSGLAGKSSLYDVSRTVSNAMVMARLGLNAFHGTMTAILSAVSKQALGLQELTRGQFKEGLMDLSPHNLITAPFETLYRGIKLGKEYTSKTPYEQLTPELQAALQGGYRYKMDRTYTNETARTMMTALREQDYAKAVYKLPGTILQLAAQPIMEYLVPNLKAGMVQDAIHSQLMDWERKGYTPTEAEKVNTFRSIVDSADNRFGQLAYDNLFWNKTFKDIAHVMVQAPGWNIGDIRELGGGIKDIGSSIKSGKLSGRTAFTAMLPVTVALYGAMYAYLHGNSPQSMMDLYHPKDADGNRRDLPSYMHDVWALANNPGKTIEGKTNPLPSTIWQELNNADWNGKTIRTGGVGDWASTKVLDEKIDPMGKHILSQFMPFGIKNLMKLDNEEASTESKVENFMGISPTPKYITEKDGGKTVKEQLGGSDTTVEKSDAEKAADRERRQRAIDFVNRTMPNATLNVKERAYRRQMYLSKPRKNIWENN